MKKGVTVILPITAQPEMSKMITFTNGPDAVGAGTTYYPIMGDQALDSVEAEIQQVMPVAGTFDQLRVNLSTAPGIGHSRVFTLRKNGVDTLVTCTISNAATTGSDITHNAVFAAGDLVSIKQVNSGPAANASIAIGAQCTIP